MTLKNLTAVPDSERRPMTNAESELMITLSLSGQDISEPIPPADLEATLSKLFKPAFFDMAAQILIGRLKPTDKLYDPRVVAMCSFLSDRPGFAVLYAFTIYQRTCELGRPYSFDDLVEDFPMGFPTNDGASAIWDAQKGCAQDPKQRVDNMLDRNEAWGISAKAEA